MNHKFTAPVTIWISEYSDHDADSLQAASSAVGLVIYAENINLGAGYTKVGSGELRITMASKDQITAGKVYALREMLENDRAESQQRQNTLVRKINELLAITNEVEA